MTKQKYLLCSSIIYFVGFAMSLTIDVPECYPPDYPLWGGYGPRQEVYNVGDMIYYYCDSDAHISGNFYRRCQENGDWFGDTPVCDFPTDISFVNQTSTAEPKEEHEAHFAKDDDRNTCSSTTDGYDSYWIGMFKDPGELIRIMIFMPQGEVAYEVLLLRKNGSEISCGIQTDSITRLGWAYHVCPCRNNRDAIGVKIKSLSSKPLQICEIKAFVLTSPICVDPHLYIEYGRLQLTRKTATLFCDSGHTPSAASRVECVRDGMWNIKSLYCLENQWDAREPGSLIEKERKSFHNDP